MRHGRRMLLAGVVMPVWQATAAGQLVPADLFTVPESFEVQIWAQSPQLRNPTNIDIDHKGRVWVAEGVNYRMHEGRDEDGDRIVVLEDTDGDGRADKSSVFVQDEDIAVPLGIAVFDNQVVLSNNEDLVVYTDVDRNLKFERDVDRYEVLLSGFGYQTDHGLHSVTGGPDGRWYFNSGNAGAYFADRSHRMFRFGNAWDTGLLAPSADGHLYVGGFSASMSAEATGLEVYSHNARNSYEQAITSFGDMFQNDNDDNGSCRTTWVMQFGNMGYLSADGRRLWQADRRPGQPVPVAHWHQDDPGVVPAGDVYGNGAPTGIVVNEGDALGEQWRGVLLSAEAGRNTIFGYHPQPAGAGFALERFHFLTTNEQQKLAGLDYGVRVSGEIGTYFRPADVAIGTDGAVYVADWFDPRVGGHQDLDDSLSGAIYRVVPKQSRLAVPKLDLTTLDGQLAAFRSPAVNVRYVAFTRLLARGTEALASVRALLQDANPYIRARALWLLAQLGEQGVAAVEAQLAADDPQIRVAAVRALRRVATDSFADQARALAKDPSAAVRRELALSLRDAPLDTAREPLLELARSYDGEDRSYLEAWGVGAAGKEQALYRALADGAQTSDPLRWSRAYANLMWRLRPEQEAASFAKRAAAPGLSAEERNAAITALGFIPTQAAADALLELADEDGRPVTENVALWWLLNFKDTRWAGMQVDAGLKVRGLYDADQLQFTEVIVPEPAPSRLPPVAEIAALDGNAARGKERAAACLACHRIAGNGVDYAPNLDGFAGRQAREATIIAIRDPSAAIAHGFEATEIRLDDGTRIQGLLLKDGDPSIIQSTGGAVQLIPAARISDREDLTLATPAGQDDELTYRSLMLSADQLGLSAQDVADIVAYLQAVK